MVYQLPLQPLPLCPPLKLRMPLRRERLVQEGSALRLWGFLFINLSVVLKVLKFYHLICGSKDL